MQKRVALLVASIALGVMLGTAPGCSSTSKHPEDATPFTLQQDATICALLQACLPGQWQGAHSWGPRIGTCAEAGFKIRNPSGTDPRYDHIYGGVAAYRALYACVLGAEGDCFKVHACLAGSAAPESCDPAMMGTIDVGGQCDGQFLASCSADHLLFRLDCGLAGGDCDPLRGKCIPSVCTGAGTSRCEGSIAVSCPDDSADCAASGGECQPPASPGDTAKCVFPPCDAGPTGATSTCNGTVISSCTSRYGLTQSDCASFATERRCENGFCVHTGQDCVSGLDDDVCLDGGQLRVCADDTFVTIDCPGLGFSGCADGGCVH